MNWLQQIAEWLSRFKCWYIVRPWEQAILVRCGRWIIDAKPGMHLRIPLLDEVFIQNVRLRVLNLPVQTATSKDGTTITLSAVVQWKVEDVRLMYDRLHNPEDWLYNVVLAAIAKAVNEIEDATPSSVVEAAAAHVDNPAYFGLWIAGISITDFAVVRTYRLITGEGNSGWSWNRVGALETGSR